MRHLHLFRSCLLAALAGLALAVPAAAQHALAVTAPFVHVDAGRRLVLVNAPVSGLRPAGDSIRSLRLDGQTFALARGAAGFSPARAYAASSAGEPYQVFFTRLPVLELTTHHVIADTPSVYAHLRLIDSTGVAAQSATGIEWRGGYSQSLPKKSYELSLWTDSLGTDDNDLALLGMRTDNKWNLQALYNDQLRLRLKVANDLWLDMHQPYYQAQEPAARSGIRMAYAEVFLNGSYQGVYALTERVDRKQLQLKKYANGVIRGELYKGTYWDQAVTFSGAPAFDNTSLTWSGFEYKEPSEVIDWINLYSFVNFAVYSSGADFTSQYPGRLHRGNAIDYFLFWNLLRATDNGGKNLYIAKYKAGEPYFFVPWDLDGVLGNDWQGLNVNVTTGLLSNGLFDRLQAETTAGGFWPAAAARWATLRAAVITPARLAASLEATNKLLLASDVYEREHLAWTDFQYDPAQLGYATTWAADRIAYLDGVFGYNSLAARTAGPLAQVQLYPNPASGTVYVSGLGQAGQLRVSTLGGQQVLQASLPAGAAPAVSLGQLPPGLYLAQVTSNGATVVRKLVVE